MLTTWGIVIATSHPPSRAVVVAAGAAVLSACLQVVQQLKNSERPLALTFQQFVTVGAPGWL
eukprot:COSAG03_NODE_28893_length_193_cov_12.627660_1_plen_61_part_01